ncbi:MAG: phospholipase D-like domain-containing protein [Nanoarchaeota archaeon]
MGVFMRASVVSCLLALTLVSACVHQGMVQDTGSIDVVMCRDVDCGDLFASAVKNATDVRCAFYSLSHPGLQDALRAAHAQVLVFDENFKGFGSPVSSQGLMHDKFCVLDGRRVVTGSYNPSSSRNWDNVVLLDSAVIARNYAQEWDELAEGSDGRVASPVVNLSGIVVENAFCPEDACEELLIRRISQAESRVRFMVFSFTSRQVAEALVDAQGRGVDVRGVFDASQAGKYSQHTYLAEQGISVTIDQSSGLLHHKVFVIDDEIVVTGSYNPTRNGDDRNDENVVVMHGQDIAAVYGAEFERIAG